jgi:hypothetical protein
MFSKWIRAGTRAAIGMFAAIGLTLVLVTFTPVTSIYARCAYRKSHFPLVILTGAQAAHDMRDFLTFQRVPADVIRLEPRATSRPRLPA